MPSPATARLSLRLSFVGFLELQFMGYSLLAKLKDERDIGQDAERTKEVSHSALLLSE